MTNTQKTTTPAQLIAVSRLEKSPLGGAERGPHAQCRIQHSQLRGQNCVAEPGCRHGSERGHAHRLDHLERHAQRHGSGHYSQLAASGLINLGGSTLSLVLGFEPPVEGSFEIVTNTGSAAITGTFNGLDEGAVLTQNGFQFQITYQGGTGSDSVVSRLV